MGLGKESRWVRVWERAKPSPETRAVGGVREEPRKIFNRILPFLGERCKERASALSPS